MPKKKIIKYGVILSFMMAMAVLLFPDQVPAIDREKIFISSFIDYSSEYNFRQTLNNCGPFNVAAIVRTLKKRNVDSHVFADEIEWKIPRMGTHPWGMEKQLKEYGIVIEVPVLKFFSHEDKILFLKEKLSQKRPLILLGRMRDFQHYITLFGFNTLKDEFYAYDSFYEKHIEVQGLTKDSNADLPGNRNFTSEELLDFWQGGGMYGFYKWYVIVANAEKSI